MAIVITDVVKGALKVADIPQAQCFKDFTDFITRLPQFLSVEIPASVTNIVIGVSQPTEDQRDFVWGRRDVNGNFLGFYIFNKGKWVPNYSFAPGQVIRIAGDSRIIPDGFQLADESNAALPPGVAGVLMGQWLRDPTNTYFLLFDVTFVGF